MLAFRTLEFDRIVADCRRVLSLTPLGRARLWRVAKPATELRKSTLPALQHGTSETVAVFRAEPRSSRFARRARGLVESLASLGIEGRPLKPLFAADFGRVRGLGGAVARRHPGREGFVSATERNRSQLASFKAEVGAVREAIDVSGEVLDNAGPALRGIRDRLRHLRQKLRQTLEQFARGKDTSRYLQDEVITERNGRYVLLVRAEHRGNVPGIVHGSSGSGASLFLEPAATVEINNDIVELEEREREEIFRILLELTDRFRRRPGDLRAVESVATELDVLQARARHSARLGGIEPVFVADPILRTAGGATSPARESGPHRHRAGTAQPCAPHHRPEYRGQDRRPEDRRIIRAHGPVRTARPGGDRAAAGVPIGVRGHR